MSDDGHVTELLDAYALGAVEEGEAASVESHVAECMECWSELGKARETAAMLSLSVPVVEAPTRLGERIVSTAQRETAPVRTEGSKGFFGRIGLGWPIAAGAVGVASVAVIALGISMQSQIDDLEDENEDLVSDLQAETFALEQDLLQTEQQIHEQETLLAVVYDDEAVEFAVEPQTAETDGGAMYRYSEDVRSGVVQCVGLDPLPPGRLYEVWAVTAEGPHAVATFLPQDGDCLVAMKLGYLSSPPTAIGVTVETIPGNVSRPSGKWLLYSELPQD